MVVLVNQPPPEVGIKYSEPNIKAMYKDRCLGTGTLYIAESTVCWVTDGGQGFSLQYPSINAHAISKDPSSFPEPCLYLMLEEQLDDEEQNDAAQSNSESSDDEDDQPECSISEIRFVPGNQDVLPIMYRAMTECQALNPDPEDQESDDDGGGGDDESGNYDDAEDEGPVIYENGECVPALYAATSGYVNGTAQEEGDEDSGLVGQVQEEEPMDVGQFEDADP